MKLKVYHLALIAILIFTIWLWNAAKLANCDFESNYKCEVIHAVGVVIPPAALVTVWFASDAK